MEKVAVSLGFGVCSLPAGNRAVGGGMLQMVQPLVP